MGQEPCIFFNLIKIGSEQEIKKFVLTNFNVDFKLFSKIEVNGANVHPIYNYLRQNSPLHDPKTGKTKVVPWNFAKFLINKEGLCVGLFGP